MASRAIRAKNKQGNKPSGVAGLPDGITEVGDGVYEFDAGEQRIRMMITGSADDREVNFMVDGGLDSGLLAGKEADRAAIKLMRIMKYDASTRPDGFKYYTSAHIGDGRGATRTTAFMRMGFSQPANGQPGGDQFAIVQGGKIIPDSKRVNRATDELGLPREARDFLAGRIAMRRQNEKAS